MFSLFCLNLTHLCNFVCQRNQHRNAINEAVRFDGYISQAFAYLDASCTGSFGEFTRENPETNSEFRPENGRLEYDCFLLFPLQPIFRGELFVLWSAPFNKTSLNSCVLPGISVLVLGRFSAVEELWLRVWLKGRGLNSSWFLRLYVHMTNVERSPY